MIALAFLAGLLATGPCEDVLAPFAKPALEAVLDPSDQNRRRVTDEVIASVLPVFGSCEFILSDPGSAAVGNGECYRAAVGSFWPYADQRQLLPALQKQIEFFRSCADRHGLKWSSYAVDARLLQINAAAGVTFVRISAVDDEKQEGKVPAEFRGADRLRELFDALAGDSVNWRREAYRTVLRDRDPRRWAAEELAVVVTAAAKAKGSQPASLLLSLGSRMGFKRAKRILEEAGVEGLPEIPGPDDPKAGLLVRPRCMECRDISPSFAHFQMERMAYRREWLALPADDEGQTSLNSRRGGFSASEYAARRWHETDDRLPCPDVEAASELIRKWGQDGPR